MKFFLRGLLATGAFALASTFVGAADTVSPPVAPTNKMPVATSPAIVPGADCGCNGTSTRSGGKVLGGRLGGRFGSRATGARVDGLGARADHVAEGYIAANDRLGAFFNRLAGPAVDVAAAPHGGHKGGPGTQPGTLAFPQHPFVRSPRDYFMTEQP